MGIAAVEDMVKLRYWIATFDADGHPILFEGTIVLAWSRNLT